MKLTKLQSLAEGTSKDDGQTKVFKIMDPLTDLIEPAYENVTKIMEKLHSDVLTDLLKQEGFPATESKAAKDAAKAAHDAVGKLYQELDDLHMSLGMHFADVYHGAGINENSDVYVFSTGVDEGSPRRTKGDAAKVCKKMLSVFKSDLRDMGATPEEMAKFNKMAEITDPVKLFKALIRSKLCWDGYDVELKKNDKVVSKP